MKNIVKTAAFMAILSLVTAPAMAELVMPGIFGDKMVLQRNKPIRLWGKANPDSEVNAVLGELASKKTKTDSSGNWIITLPACNAKGAQKLTVKSGDETLSFTDVLLGEVWVNSGQSNMHWPTSWLKPMPAEAAEANFPEIRVFTVGRNCVAEGPVWDCSGDWHEGTSPHVQYFSAVGFFFARHLHLELGCPIGMISTAVGGTPVESWTSKEVNASIPQIQGHIGYLKRQQQSWNPEKEMEKYNEKFAEWKKKADAAKAAGKKAPGKPRKPRSMLAGGWYPSCLYNGMIAPIIPYTIRGAIWYQGESNAGRPEDYLVCFPAMIKDWRDRWELGDFPFYFVQLAAWQPGGEKWAWLRDSQTKTLDISANTGMAVAIDIGDKGNIHPPKKVEVGKRLALWALAKDYKQKVEYSGPLYKSSIIEGDSIIIEFTHASGLHTNDGKTVSNLLIAGKDQNFVAATGEIMGGKLVVRSTDGSVNSPVAVRYAWSSYPENPNLYNSSNLPASPFRTDDRPRNKPE